MNPLAYQTPAGLEAKPMEVKRQGSGGTRWLWRVAGANGRWRMPTGREYRALYDAYGTAETAATMALPPLAPANDAVS